QAMKQLHNQDRIFATGLHALDLKIHSVEQRIVNAKERINERLEAQREDISSLRKLWDGIEEHRSQSDKVLGDL
ncbi:hypothetical protein BgiBS90_023681, partial [Biomphalaria glabrata]